jgi:hypothetical protein
MTPDTPSSLEKYARDGTTSVLMASTGHRTFATFQRYNNPTEEDVKAVVLANPPKKMLG